MYAKKQTVNSNNELKPQSNQGIKKEKEMKVFFSKGTAFKFKICLQSTALQAAALLLVIVAIGITLLPAEAIKAANAEAISAVATEAKSASDNEPISAADTEAISAAAPEVISAADTKEINSANTEAESRLSVQATRLWFNGTGTFKITVKDHAEDEELTITPVNRNYQSISIVGWDGDTCTVKVTPNTIVATYLTISCAGESTTIKVTLRKEAEMSATSIYRYLYDAMVEINSWDSEGTLYTGSGFFVGNGLVLTAYHVVEAASKMEISDYSGRVYKIKEIVGYDKKKNLILIRVSAKNKRSLCLSTEGINGGERIYSFGSPVGITAIFREGIVSNNYILSGGKWMFQCSIPSGTGSGGGPVVNTRGQVIGMLTNTVGAAEDLNLAIRYEELRAFINGITPDMRRTVKAFYKENAGKTKESNNYNILGENSTDGNSEGYADIFEELSSVEIYERAHDAMVSIYVEFNESLAGIGSGFFINDNTIVTCAHLFDHGDFIKVEVNDYSGNLYMVDRNSMKINPEYDLAILTVQGVTGEETHASLDVMPGYIPAGGETVYAYGDPQGWVNYLSEGVVAYSSVSLEAELCEESGIATDNEYIIFGAATSEGNSGGPLINKYGKVIGVVTNKSTKASHINLAVRLDYLRKVA